MEGVLLIWSIIATIAALYYRRVAQVWKQLHTNTCRVADGLIKQIVEMKGKENDLYINR